METVTKSCQNCRQDFLIEPDDFGFYLKVGVPEPTFCPKCRSQRRLAWRNNLSLYNRTCGLCNKSVVTLYASDSGIVVYCNKCWWSDKWDPKDYGVDYDFSKPFFTQYREMLQKVPHMAVVNDDGIASVNCEYTHDTWFSRNCYMLFSAWRTENVMYSFLVAASEGKLIKDAVDCLNILQENQRIYECTSCGESYQLKNSQFCVSCIDSQFLYDCRACTDCFMCAGLRNKKYCFKNVQYSKEEYEKILAEYKLDTFSGTERAQKEYDEFILSYPRRFAYIVHSVYSTGDVLTNCKNVKNSYGIHNGENCRYYDYAATAKDCYDITMSGELSECYENIVADHSYHNFFGIFSVKSQEIRYTQHCHDCKNVFGCAALRKSQFCILNKQYTKEEYEALVPKIIVHMNTVPYKDKNDCEYHFGEFYPIELSVFGYNESVALDQMHLTREEALAKGFKWQDNLQITTGKETLTSENIPESINDIREQITNEILACLDCRRNYKITQNELTFYRMMKIPIPRRCFHCRHHARILRRNPLELWHRTCMCIKENHEHTEECPNEFETSYAPERPEIVYCESCYQKEVN
jgi:hypothetical protein